MKPRLQTYKTSRRTYFQLVCDHRIFAIARKFEWPGRKRLHSADHRGVLDCTSYWFGPFVYVTRGTWSER